MLDVFEVVARVWGVVEISAINAEKKIQMPRLRQSQLCGCDVISSSFRSADRFNHRYLCVCDAGSVRRQLPGYIWTLLGLKLGCLLAVVSLCLSLSLSVLGSVFQRVC